MSTTISIIPVPGFPLTGATLTAISRFDTEESVEIPDPAEFSYNPTSGAWEIGVDIPEEVDYFWEAQVYYVAGGSAGTDGIITGGRGTNEAAPSSKYFTYDEFIKRFGLRNVSRHSRSDQDEQHVPDFERLKFAFDDAEEELDNFFRLSPYVIPFVFSEGVPAVVRKWAMSIAYADLYLARGMSDEKQPTKIQLMKERTLSEMALYRGGQRELPTASRRSGDGLVAGARPGL
jgi:phage gp36-like protein